MRTPVACRQATGWGTTYVNSESFVIGWTRARTLMSRAAEIAPYGAPEVAFLSFAITVIKSGLLLQRVQVQFHPLLPPLTVS